VLQAAPSARRPVCAHTDLLLAVAVAQHAGSATKCQQAALASNCSISRSGRSNGGPALLGPAWLPASALGWRCAGRRRLGVLDVVIGPARSSDLGRDALSAPSGSALEALVQALVPCSVLACHTGLGHVVI